MTTKADCRVSSLVALLLACGCTTTEGIRDRSEDVATHTEADAPSCTTATATSGFGGGSLAPHSGRIRVDLDATPGSSPGDALVGLAEFAPLTYADLAAIARFNVEGNIDARDGSSYRATTVVPYEAGRTHRLRFEIDTAAHRYSLIDLQGSGGPFIADDFAFRSEQNNADGIGAFGMKVDEGEQLSVCNVLIADSSCTAARPHEGFVNSAFSPQQSFVTVGFDATPSAAGMDAVLGVSAGEASSFDDVAAAVRFNPDGNVNVRDGDTYRTSSGPVTYAAGTTYHFLLLIDVASHRYSVLLNGDRIAEDFAFRTPQAGVGSLDNFVLESDADTGTVLGCNWSIAPARDAVYVHATHEPAATLVPLPDGRLLMVEESRTLVLDTAGVVSGTLPFTGPVAVDGAGHLYRTGVFSGTFDAGTGPLTSAGGNDGYLVEYDTAMNPVHSARFGGEGDDTISSPRVNARGDVLFVLDGQAVRLDAERSVAYDAVPIADTARLALDANGNVFVSENPHVAGQLSVTKLGPNGDALWTHDMPILSGSVNLGALAADATGGVVFAGEIQGKFDLGGPWPFAIIAGEDGPQTYIAKLDGDGGYVYANATNVSDLRDLGVDALGNTAVWGTHVNPFRARVNEYGPSGEFVREVSAESLVPPLPFGVGPDAVIDSAGNVYLRFALGPQEIGRFLAKVRAP